MFADKSNIDSHKYLRNYFLNSLLSWFFYAPITFRTYSTNPIRLLFIFPFRFFSLFIFFFFIFIFYILFLFCLLKSTLFDWLCPYRLFLSFNFYIHTYIYFFKPEIDGFFSTLGPIEKEEKYSFFYLTSQQHIFSAKRLSFC